MLGGVGGALFLGRLPDLISRVPATPGALPPSFFALFGSLGIDFVLLALGGILTIVGLIGGQILGLWRVGTRYNETTIKVGAIFTVIAFEHRGADPGADRSARGEGSAGEAVNRRASIRRKGWSKAAKTGRMTTQL